MTVCIAALADVGKSLVLACDSMLSGESFSGDHTALKMYPLTAPFQWWAMVAGDVSHAVPIIESAVLGLFGLSDSTNTRETVERAVVSAYQGVRRQLAEDLVLTPIGANWGSVQGESVFAAKLAEELKQVSVGCELLVAGFDWSGDGYIFSVTHPGIVRNHNVCGYEAIGTGAYNAMATLMYHSVNQEMKLAPVLYHVCESKFMAESADGVGRHTHVKIATGAGKMDAYELSDEFIDGIRKAWEDEGRPRVPRNLIGHLERELKRHPAGPLV